MRNQFGEGDPAGNDQIDGSLEVGLHMAETVTVGAGNDRFRPYDAA